MQTVALVVDLVALVGIVVLIIARRNPPPLA